MILLYVYNMLYNSFRASYYFRLLHPGVLLPLYMPRRPTRVYYHLGTLYTYYRETVT